LWSRRYVEHASKIGFCLRRAANEFEFACIAQLIQVERLMSRLCLIQIQDALRAGSLRSPAPHCEGPQPWHIPDF
jgi:hypothetical protein